MVGSHAKVKTQTSPARCGAAGDTLKGTCDRDDLCSIRRAGTSTDPLSQWGRLPSYSASSATSWDGSKQHQVPAQAVCAVYTRQTGSNVPVPDQTAGKATQQGSVSRPSDISADGGSLPDAAGPAGAFPRLYGYEVVRELPHQADAFTQGLEFDKRCAKTAAGDGFECTDIFWESTGALACAAMPV